MTKNIYIFNIPFNNMLVNNFLSYNIKLLIKKTQKLIQMTKKNINMIQLLIYVMRVRTVLKMVHTKFMYIVKEKINGSKSKI